MRMIDMYNRRKEHLRKAAIAGKTEEILSIYDDAVYDICGKEAWMKMFHEALADALQGDGKDVLEFLCKKYSGIAGYATKVERYRAEMLRDYTAEKWEVAEDD